MWAKDYKICQKMYYVSVGIWFSTTYLGLPTPWFKNIFSTSYYLTNEQVPLTR